MISEMSRGRYGRGGVYRTLYVPTGGASEIKVLLKYFDSIDLEKVGDDTRDRLSFKL